MEEAQYTFFEFLINFFNFLLIKQFQGNFRICTYLTFLFII